jgi:hypothetical protein
MEGDDMQTFGWNLLQFARSVDNLNQEIVDGMQELARDYFLSKDGLGACYFCVHRSGAKFERMPAFKTVWTSEESEEAQVVRRFTDASGSESPSLRALAYNEDRCLWVTAGRGAEGNKPPDDATLDDTRADGIEDHWREPGHDEHTLPPYIPMHNRPCRTLVALPLKHQGRKLGVLAIEFERQIPITAGARQEAEFLRKALGRILWLQDAAMAQREGTRKAFEELKNVVSESGSSVDPPTIFFAYPGRSDTAVVDAIKRIVVGDYSDQLVLSSWDQMANPGQITDQIVEEISRCRYGICYLSELAEDPAGDVRQQRYVDNRNVLIEAGMLYALRNSRLAQTGAWIPVREGDDRTEAVPFDFVAERMIQVPRGEDGNLLSKEFDEELKKRIDAMIVRCDPPPGS